MKIKMQRVESSNIHAVGYDEENRHLAVIFKDKSNVYIYRGVWSIFWEALQNVMHAGGSVGRFVNKSVVHTKTEFLKCPLTHPDGDGVVDSLRFEISTPNPVWVSSAVEETE